MKERILLIDSETPGYFFPFLCNLGNYFKKKGYEVLVVIPSRTKYFRFKKYFQYSDVRIFDKDPKLNKKFEFEGWDLHASAMRQKALLGNLLINEDLYQKYLAFFDNIFIDFNPTLVISENVSNAFFSAAYRIAQDRNVLYLQMQSGRFPNSINFYKNLNYEPLSNIKSNYSNDEAEVSPDYMNSQNSKINLNELIQYLKSNFVDSPELGFVILFKIKYLLWLIKREIRSWQYLIKYQNQKAENNHKIFNGKKVYLFPLHFRPEASTSVQAKYYEDDKELIRNICFSLTNNELLIVKEHPNGLGVRSKKFYNDIEEYPNVKIVRHDTNLDYLLNNIDACITLTSTVGFEALLKKVPVILLGEVFYSKYPGVIKLESINNLRAALEKAKEIHDHKLIDPAEIKDIYSKACFNGRIDYRNEKILKKNNIILVGKSILEIVRHEKRSY